MNEEDRKNRLQLIELFHFDRHVSVDSSVSSTLGRLPTTVNVYNAARINFLFAFFDLPVIKYVRQPNAISAF